MGKSSGGGQTTTVQRGRQPWAQAEPYLQNALSYINAAQPRAAGIPMPQALGVLAPAGGALRGILTGSDRSMFSPSNFVAGRFPGAESQDFPVSAQRMANYQQHQRQLMAAQMAPGMSMAPYQVYQQAVNVPFANAQRYMDLIGQIANLGSGGTASSGFGQFTPAYYASLKKPMAAKANPYLQTQFR